MTETLDVCATGEVKNKIRIDNLKGDILKNFPEKLLKLRTLKWDDKYCAFFVSEKDLRKIEEYYDLVWYEGDNND